MRGLFSASGSEDQRSGCEGEVRSQPPASVGTAAMRDAGQRPLRRLPGGVSILVAPFTGTLAAGGIGISMDGRRWWMDNVFTQLLWRSLKYEDICLYGYVPTGMRRRRGSADGSSFTAHRPPRESPASDASVGLDRIRLPCQTRRTADTRCNHERRLSTYGPAVGTLRVAHRRWRHVTPLSACRLH